MEITIRIYFPMTLGKLVLQKVAKQLDRMIDYHLSTLDINGYDIDVETKD